MSITENYQRIRKEVPGYVTIVLASKTRTQEEITEVINAGATDIGENYVQEAEKIYNALDEKAKKVSWHIIGYLQTNKINKALQIFDVIQTVDSLEKAIAINKRAERIKKTMPVYIEVNIGSEFTKAGVKPEYNIIENLAKEISKLEYLNLEGLMTMGPRFGNPEDSRPYFRKTKEIFEKIKSLNLPNVNMKTLSMGMSNSYKVAIEEGSNMIRLGTIVFGERKKKMKINRDKMLQERIAEEEKIIEKIDENGVKWRRVYSGGGKHYEGWLSQFKELVDEDDIKVEEIDSTGFKCFENEKMYRVWIKVK